MAFGFLRWRNLVAVNIENTALVMRQVTGRWCHTHMKQGFNLWWDQVAAAQEQQEIGFGALMRWARRVMASGFLHWRSMCQVAHNRQMLQPSNPLPSVPSSGAPGKVLVPTVAVVSVKLPKTRTQKDETNKPCVYYMIDIETRTSEYQIARRYKDFDHFDLLLKELYPGVVLPELPPKKSFGTMDPHFITNRKLTLEKYLKELLVDNPVTTSSSLVNSFVSDPSRSWTKSWDERDLVQTAT